MTILQKIEYFRARTGMGMIDAQKYLKEFGNNLDDAMEYWKYMQEKQLNNFQLTRLVLEQQKEIKDLKRRIEQLEEEVVMKELE